MLPTKALFSGTEVSLDYSLKRFTIPLNVLDEIGRFYSSETANACKHVLDIGCGPGDNTVLVGCATIRTLSVAQHVPQRKDHRHRRERIGNRTGQ